MKQEQTLHRFYYPHLKLHIGTAILDGQEAMHVIKVLRLGVGDSIELIDGEGAMAQADILSVSKKSCELIISPFQTFNLPYNMEIKLAFGLIKSVDRLAFLIEKCTELGVTEFYPLITDNAERRSLNLDKIKAASIAALKQSRQYWLPRINPPTPLKTFVTNTASIEGAKYIAHCRSNNAPHLAKVYMKTEPVTIMIGPEGDFSESELDLCLENNIKPVSLGTQRLRSETAAITAIVSLTTVMEL